MADFEVGDIIIGIPDNCYSLTDENAVCLVSEFDYDNSEGLDGPMKVDIIATVNGRSHTRRSFWVEPDQFVHYTEEDHGVITGGSIPDRFEKVPGVRSGTTQSSDYIVNDPKLKTHGLRLKVVSKWLETGYFIGRRLDGKRTPVVIKLDKVKRAPALPCAGDFVIYPEDPNKVIYYVEEVLGDNLHVKEAVGGSGSGITPLQGSEVLCSSNRNHLTYIPDTPFTDVLTALKTFLETNKQD